MILQEFNLDLREKENPIFQVVAAHEVAKNSFLILGKFITETNSSDPNYIRITDAEFAIKNLDNDLKYVKIKKITFVKDDSNYFGFKLCLRIVDFPTYNSEVFPNKYTTPSEETLRKINRIKVNGDKLRIHFDFSKKCNGDTGDPINIGSFPCVTNNLI